MQNKVAMEYSQALFILACEEKKEKEYLDELKLTESLILNDPEYMLLLSSPNVRREEKLSGHRHLRRSKWAGIRLLRALRHLPSGNERIWKSGGFSHSSCQNRVRV